MTELTVVVPVYDRDTIGDTISSLTIAAPRTTIVLADSGSRCPVTCQHIGDAVSRFPDVRHLSLPQSTFHKAALLNAAVEHVDSRYILFSDADVLWTRDAIVSLNHAVHTSGGMAFVEHVTETHTTGAERTIFVANATSTPSGYEIALTAKRVGNSRPGFGLVLTSRNVFCSVGGFRDDLIGYGFEDQDLLLRAALLGHPVSAHAECVHISHPDSQRGNPMLLRQQRNANILRSLRALALGRVLGPLARTADSSAPSSSIHLCPEFLGELLDAGVE